MNKNLAEEAGQAIIFLHWQEEEETGAQDLPGGSFVCTDIFVFYCNVISGNLYLLTTLVGDCPRHDICKKKYTAGLSDQKF